jgi:hypothetical protein
MKHLEHAFVTYVYSHCNICNIPTYFCNIYIKHLQHTFKTSETLKSYSYNMCFLCNISLLLGRMEAHRHLDFTEGSGIGGACRRQAGGSSCVTWRGGNCRNRVPCLAGPIAEHHDSKPAVCRSWQGQRLSAAPWRYMQGGSTETKQHSEKLLAAENKRVNLCVDLCKETQAASTHLDLTSSCPILILIISDIRSVSHGFWL